MTKLRVYLDTVSNETERGPEPEKKGEPSEQVLTELDPFGCGRRRSQRVQAILLITLGCGGFGEAGFEVGVEPFA